MLSLPEMVTDEQELQIRDAVRANLPRRSDGGLILDCSCVELINSIGITCLLRVDEDCRKAGAKMYLAQVRAPIAQFLKQVGLDRKFVVMKTVDDAVAALTRRV